MRKIASPQELQGELKKLLDLAGTQQPSRQALANGLRGLADRLAAYDTPAEAIRKAIDLMDYLPNGVSAWVEAHGGDKTLASKNGTRLKKIVDELGEILTSMPASVTYTVYGLDMLELRGTVQPRQVYKNREDLIEGMKALGIRYTGISSNSSQFRAELRGQPEFDKLVGPMYDGAGQARYETGPLNERMSR